MPKRKKKETRSEKDKLCDLLTCFEEAICEALTLNSALMVLMDNPRFSELNYEILLQISYRLGEAKGRLPEGYQLKLG